MTCFATKQSNANRFTKAECSFSLISSSVCSCFNSIKALKRERDMLCKQMLRTFSASERNDLFQQWGIGLNTKQRRLQLCNKLWKNTKDMEHLKQSAALVAKLVGIIEPNEASKEMFGLSFAPQPMNLRSFSWTPRMPFMI